MQSSKNESLILYQFSSNEKCLAAFACVFGTIVVLIQTFYPIIDIKIHPLFLIFCIIIVDLTSFFVVFRTYICLDLKAEVFISKACGATQIKVCTSQIKRLQINHNPDTDRVLIELLLRDGTVKNVNWDQNFRSHAYKKQKERCHTFVDKCNSAINNPYS